MKRIKWLLFLFIPLLLLGVIYSLFRPQPIVSDMEHGAVLRIRVNLDGVLSDLTDFDEKAIMSVLSSSYEQRTFEKAGVFSLDDVEVAVTFTTETGFKEILLGAINYSYEGYNRPKYRIMDAQELERSLLEVLFQDLEGNTIKQHSYSPYSL